MNAAADPMTEQGRVLIVDDDERMRASVEALLALQFKVTTAKGMAEAMSALDQAVYDVVLTDYDMPGGTGLELMQAIQARFPSAMIICVTGHPDLPELRESEVQRELLRVIAKPYDPKRLLSWVDNAVKLSRLHQATSRIAEKRKR